MDETASRIGTGKGNGGERPVKVLKFGGSSLASAGRIASVVEIVRASAKTHGLVVVASAVGRTTDDLVEFLSAGEDDGPSILDRIRSVHLELAGGILSEPSMSLYTGTLEAVLGELLKEKSHSNLDAVLAAGERMSVPLLALALREAGLDAAPFDATRFIRTDDSVGQAQVDVDETYRLVRSWHRGLDPAIVAVVTGFVGSTEDGRVTTLGRGGSDYSAALIACALGADALERWTDVDGLYTWDPRKRCGARRLATMVLSEAVAWNHAGRLGMHRKALDPIIAASIPVYVRSTFLPEQPGTVILPAAE